jgi:hypothetical protein
VYGIALSASEVGQNYRHGRDYVYTDLIDDTNLKLHFDAADLTSSANTTWTDKKSSVALTKSGTVNYDDELGDWIDFGGGYYGNDSYTGNIEDASGNTTVEFWYNPDSLTAQNAIVQFQKTSESRWHIGFYNSQLLSYYYGTSSTAAQAINLSTLGLTLNKWNHVSISKTPTSMKFYLNGELKRSDTFSTVGAGAQSIAGIRVGDVDFVPAYGSDGQLGQIRVYKAELTQDEVRQNYNFTKPSYPNGVDMSKYGAIFDTSTHTNPDVDAFSFDGSNDYFDNNNTFNTNLGSSSYTLSAWIYVQGSISGGGAYVIMATIQGGSGLQLDIIKANGNLRLYHSGGTAVNQQSSSSISSNTWYHVICIRDRELGKVNFFIDGVAAGSTSISSANGSASGTGFEIGRYNSGYYFNGDIAQVKVFNKAMTTAEAQALFNQNATTFGKTEV